MHVEIVLARREAQFEGAVRPDACSAAAESESGQSRKHRPYRERCTGGHRLAAHVDDRSEHRSHGRFEDRELHAGDRHAALERDHLRLIDRLHAWKICRRRL